MSGWQSPGACATTVRMTDPVALAYSGRVEEAREAALAQSSSDDPYLREQALEALAVLGQQHGVAPDAAMEAVLVASSGEHLRRSLEAATALGSRALDPLVEERLRAGAATWEMLRHVEELPTLALGRALAAGWDRLPPSLLDEAVLATGAVPVSSREEAIAWGTRVLAAAAHRSEHVRIAALRALALWQPEGTADACARALEVDSPELRLEAARTLAMVDLPRLAELAPELVPKAARAPAPPA